MGKNVKNVLGAGVSISSKIVKGSMLTMIVATATGLILSVALDIVERKERK